ncbi:MAG: hypothetical protein JWN73_2918 [Betaproteobacteria bacterium]|nr:hypothetical protein [Betaproteobacteria bacterium]
MAFLESLVPVTNSKGESRAEAVARQIEATIIRKKIAPASALGTKEDMQGRLNVARGTINEAFRLLKSRDVIEMRPGPKGGIFVSQATPLVRFGDAVLKLKHSPSMLEECFLVKDALDPWVAREAALQRTPADIKDLLKIVAEMEATVDAPMKDRMLLNWRLHRRIAKSCRNAVLQSLYLSILDIVAREPLEVIKSSEPSRAHHAKRNRLHKKLVEAIAKGDGVAAFSLGGDAHRFPVHGMKADENPGGRGRQ